MSELDHDGQTLHVASMVDQVSEIINIFIHHMMTLEVTGGLQFGKGYLCFILQTELSNECRPEF
jgi:hypothetical protein